MSGTLQEARNLAQRFQEGELFRRYVVKRRWRVAPLGLLILMTSIACAAATIVFFAHLASLLALPGIVLAPVVLFASLFVQAFVLFSWLENRALARARGRAVQPPDVPWGLAAVALVLPLAILAFAAPAAALALIALQVTGPLLYAHLDR